MKSFEQLMREMEEMKLLIEIEKKKQEMIKLGEEIKALDEKWRREFKK
jgi:hypothetical protein